MHHLHRLEIYEKLRDKLDKASLFGDVVKFVKDYHTVGYCPCRIIAKLNGGFVHTLLYPALGKV